MSEMTDRVLRKLNDYADARKRDVARGLETPELAGLLVQKYGYGLADALAEAFPEFAGISMTYSDVDRAVKAVDPNWEETQAARWKARAGLDLSIPRNEG